jgi:hypothetical protein
MTAGGFKWPKVQITPLFIEVYVDVPSQPLNQISIDCDLQLVTAY